MEGDKKTPRFRGVELNREKTMTFMIRILLNHRKFQKKWRGA